MKETVFLDGRMKNLPQIARKIRDRFPDAFVAVFGIGLRHKYIGTEEFWTVDIPGVPEDGISIQEWLNRNINDVSAICIVTEAEEIRPLTEYIVHPGFMFVHKVKEMLQKPYKNKMYNMVHAGNMRKHF